MPEKDGGIFMSENKLNASKRMKRKPWPRDCIWPEPLNAGEGMQWDEVRTNHLQKFLHFGAKTLFFSEFVL